MQPLLDMSESIGPRCDGSWRGASLPARSLHAFALRSDWGWGRRSKSWMRRRPSESQHEPLGVAVVGPKVSVHRLKHLRFSWRTALLSVVNSLSSGPQCARTDFDAGGVCALARGGDMRASSVKCTQPVDGSADVRWTGPRGSQPWPGWRQSWVSALQISFA